jgi:hypothetical protein
MSDEKILQQRGLFAGQRRFEIRDNRYLFVEMQGVKNTLRYQLDLMALQPDSQRHFTIAWRWLLASAASILLLVLILQGIPLLFDVSLEAWALPLTLGLVGLAFLFLILFFSASYREYRYTSRHCGFPLVRLLAGKPSRKQFRGFRKQLEQGVRQRLQNSHLTPQQERAGELRLLRRLAKCGVLREEDYEQAKQQLVQ